MTFSFKYLEEIRKRAQHDIFISYQWDNQSEVMAIRTKMEKAGFSCWMDIGQMGGGDHLYNEIYKGIFHCQVILIFREIKSLLTKFMFRPFFPP